MINCILKFEVPSTTPSTDIEGPKIKKNTHMTLTTAHLNVVYHP